MSLLINFFVLILVQIHFVWFCSCRLCVSRGLPSEAAAIHSLLSLSVLSFFYPVSDVDFVFGSLILVFACL